jgi:phosphatidylserine/phosphatidylglycerophosphate/cardiolipin synthase-like enzyme
MAYAFTSAPVAEAIVEVRKRKIPVRAVLDKSNRSDKYSASDFLSNAGVPVRIDGGVAISHNKVIVIDSEIVITGSYNFTRAAEERNAENVVFIRDRCTARQYEENFEARWKLSAPYKGRQ